MHQTQESFSFPLNFQPQWFDFDLDNHVYKKLHNDEPVDALIARGEKDSATMSRLWAATQLGEVHGPAVDAAVQALSSILAHDTFYGVRMASAQSLGRLGGDQARSALLNALHQDDSHTRTAVVEALGNFSNDAQVYAAIVKALHDDASGRALTYLTDLFGTDSDAEVRKSTLQTPYRESIRSAFGRLSFSPNGRSTSHFSMMLPLLLRSILQ